MNKTNLIRALTLLLLPSMLNAAPSTYSPAVTNLNPAGYWPMHEVAAPAPGDIETNYGSLGLLGTGFYTDYQVNSGAFIRQAPGALANDTDPCVYFTAGTPGGGTTTNGLFIPHTSPLTTLKPPFSLECWVYLTNCPPVGTSMGDVISESDGSKIQGVRLYCQNGANFTYTAICYNHAGASTQINFNVVSSNQWHHLVLTCDASTNMIVYTDGAKSTPLSGSSSASFAGKYDFDYHEPLSVGTGLGNARAQRSLIDEVAIYTNALSAATISQHYNDGLSGSAGAYFQDVTNANPTIYLRMDSSPYSVPPVSLWPVLQNDGQTNGVDVDNGVYNPGTMPGVVSGTAYGYFPLGLNATDVALFSGVSSFADAGYSPAYNPVGTTPFSVAALFRGNPTDTNRVQSIVGRGTNSWELGLTVGGSLVFNSGTNSAAVVATGSGAGDLVSTSSGYDDGNWHQVVAVHNGTNNALYIDGVLNKTNIVTANNVGNSLDVLIGSDPCYTNTPVGFGRQFAGEICEVAFFTNALSAAQIQNLYTLSGVVPVITQQPVSATLNAGVNFTNSVVINGGSAPISYQWYVNNSAIGGATNSTLAFTPLTPGNASSNYYAVVTNNYGAVTSAVVSLTVYGTPIFVAQFPIAHTNPITLYGGSSPATLGSSPTFSVSTIGPPSVFQWLTNGVAVAGATNSSFTFTNCQMNGPVSFQCVVTNSYGSATSMLWSVTYVAAPTAPFLQTVLADRPVTYWRLDEPDRGLNDGDDGVICKDYQSANNGIYTNMYLSNYLSGTGYSQSTDPTENAAQFGAYSAGSFAGTIGTNIDFSAPTGSNAEFSVAVWANGNQTGQPNNAGLVTKGYLNNEEFTLDEGAPGQGLRFEVRNAAGTAYSANSAVKLGNDASWHFVVGVCDEANGSVELWIDGTDVTNVAIPSVVGITNASAVPIMIGARATSASNLGNNQFYGFLNEAGLYNYALSSNQIVHLFQVTGIAPLFTEEPPANTNANYGGTLVLAPEVVGTPVLSYRWYDVGASSYMAGQTNASLVISNFTASDSYYLTVSNAYGSTNSTTISVTAISGAPAVYVSVQDPFYGIGGRSTENTVEAYGTAPLFYQWQEFEGGVWVNLADNGRITGSKTPTLTIAEVYGSDAGNYQVVVSNAIGSVTSQGTLVVASLPLNFYGSGLFWSANGSARISSGLLSLTDPNNGGGGGTFFFQYPQYIGAFSAAFTYQAGGAMAADGVTFCLQNDPRGPAAVGSAGGDLEVGGGTPISPSAELMLDIFGGSGYAFGTNGANVPNNGAHSLNFAPPGNVALNTGDPINITVSYADEMMALTFMDTVNSNYFSTNLYVGDLTAILGADTAYVGFTGSYGGSQSVQTITNFTFVSEATVDLQVNGHASAVLSWPEDILGYVLQQNSNLASTNWLTVTNLDTTTNGEHQITLPFAPSNVYYRLMLAQ